MLMLFSCNRHLKNVVKAGDCISGDSAFIPEVITSYDNYKMVFYKDASLVISEAGTPEVKSGNKLVFEYLYHKKPAKQKKDAGYNERILFEADPLSGTFLLSDDELKAAHAAYGNLCFCPDAGYHQITVGCIKGTETGTGVWHIEMNIKAYGQERVFTKMLSEKFLLTE